MPKAAAAASNPVAVADRAMSHVGVPHVRAAVWTAMWTSVWAAMRTTLRHRGACGKSDSREG